MATVLSHNIQSSDSLVVETKLQIQYLEMEISHIMENLAEGNYTLEKALNYKNLAQITDSVELLNTDLNSLKESLKELTQLNTLAEDFLNCQQCGWIYNPNTISYNETTNCQSCGFNNMEG